MNFTYQTRRHNELNLTFYGFENYAAAPCIVYVHGFKGFKDWGFVPYIGQKFAEAGFVFLCFNFSHNGVEGHGQDFTRLDKFEQNTHSLEVSELMEVIDLLTIDDYFGKFNEQPLGLLGHSRGGGTAILAASQHDMVSALATWASVCRFDRYDKPQMAQWEQQGYLEFPNTRTGQIMRMGKEMLADIQQNGRESLAILDAAKNLRKPFLILHGDQDATVHFYEAEQLNLYAHPNFAHYDLILGADHTFGALHPFAGTTPFLEEAFEKSLAFFRKSLGR